MHGSAVMLSVVRSTSKLMISVFEVVEAEGGCWFQNWEFESEICFLNVKAVWCPIGKRCHCLVK